LGIVAGEGLWGFGGFGFPFNGFAAFKKMVVLKFLWQG